MATLWLERVHPEYEERVRRNTFVDDHYTGEALQKARKAAQSMRANEPTVRRDLPEDAKVPVTTGTQGIGVYLYRRAQGENVYNFDERARISKFPDDFAAIIDAHIGSVSEPDATRKWESDKGTSPLGDPMDDASTMGHLWKNADGKGTNWETLFTQAGNRGVRSVRLWYMVDGPTDEYQHPKIHLLDQKAVRNWIEKDGMVVDAILHESVDTRTELQTEDEPREPYEDQYLHLTLDGWTRYKVVGDGKDRRAEKIGEADWDNPFFDDPDRTRQCLPLGYIELPLSRDVAHSMAEGVNYLFNLASDTRHILRVANHPKLVGEVDGGQWESTKEEIKEGNNILLGKWAFISPDSSNASASYEIYDKEARKYWVTSFENLNDAAKEATATEIVHRDRGRQAFLVLLAKFLDELENRILFLLSQIIDPAKPDTWRIASVQRDTNFQPLDPESMFDRRKTAFFGTSPVPSTPEIRAEIARDLHEMEGYELDESQVTAIQQQIEREQKAQEGVQGGIQGRIQQMKQRVAV